MGQRIRLGGYVVQNSAPNTPLYVIAHPGLVSPTLQATAENLTFAAFGN